MRNGTVLQAALATLAATAAHHVYGGIIYRTPWRLHGAAFAVAIGIVLIVLHWAREHMQRSFIRRVLGWTFALVVLISPVLAIGAFEGVYNHLLKNVLFFGGASHDLLVRLFPSPKYELPNDVLFEVSGVAQIVPAVWTALSMRSYLRGRRASNNGRDRLAVGDAIRAHRIFTIRDECVGIPDPERIVHLQFRRFAGCPVCNLHLQSFVRAHERISAAAVREVVVFHSSAQELYGHAAHLPFAVIPDPGKSLYKAFGVEAAPRALLDPRAWAPIVVAVIRALIAVVRGRERVPSVNPRGGRLGLPADFLIGTDGRVLACKYGEHVYDQWSVDEVLGAAALARCGGSGRIEQRGAVEVEQIEQRV